MKFLPKEVAAFNYSMFLNKSIGQKGFSLLETLVYLGLFAIVMTGIIAVAFSIFEGSGRNQTKVMVQTEGNFLLGKINWAMNDATTTSVTITPPSLTITRNSNPTTVVFDLDSGGNNMEINGSILNNSNVTVSNLSFPRSGVGTPVESVTASFTLNTLLPTGQPYTQNFQTTKYLRK